MKKNFQSSLRGTKQSILSFQLLIFLLFAVACNSPRNNDNPPVESVVAPDSLFVPTGNAELDSLLRLTITGTVTEKMNALDALIYKYVTTNKSLTLQYANEMLRLAKKEGNIKREGDAYGGIAGSYFYDGQADSALFYLEKQLMMYEAIKDDYLIMETKRGIAQTLKKSFRYDESLKLFQECLDYTTKTGQSAENKARILQNIAALYSEMKLNDISIDYYKQALNIFNTLDKEPQILRDIGCCYSSIGINLGQKEEYQKAIEYYEKSLEFFRQINDKYYSCYSLRGLVDCYLALDKDEQAYDALDKLESFAKTLNNNLLLRDALELKARYHYKQQQYQKALLYAQEALSFCRKNNARNIPDVYEILALASAHAGTPQETTDYIKKYIKLSRERFDEERNNKVTEMSAKYETAKKELEIENKNQIIKSQNLQRGLLVGGIALSLVILILLWYMLRLRNRRNHALTERNTALSERNEALADMNATKDKFFNIISHDLKNPAEAQRDALKLLVQHVGQWDANILAKYFEGLLETAEGQVELIYNLLGWAQLQTGRMVYRPSTFNLAAGLRSDISLIRNMAGKKDITVDVRIPEDADVTGDSNMLSAAVRNLLSNAIKFTPVGGTVTLEASPYPSTPFPLQVLPPTGEEKGKRELGGEFSPPSGELVGACISITDTGIGMTEEEISSLFRLDSAQSRRGTAGEQGSGLGLIVCKELLEKHGSVLHVESTPGNGSRFWFTI